MTESSEIPHLSAEQLAERRREISSLREQEGKEQETLALIRPAREDARILDSHEDVVDLYWEEFLVGRHLGDLEMMRQAAGAADEYVEAHNVESKKPRNNRFMGIILLEDGDYEGAEQRFRDGIELFEKMDDPEQRVNALELRGYLAETLIWEGEVDDGIEEGIEAFEDFDTTDGALLQERDPYTWAVWKSGVAIKMWDAVLGTEASLPDATRSRLTQLLDLSQDAIDSVPSDKIWGNFSIRNEQLNGIRQKITS